MRGHGEPLHDHGELMSAILARIRQDESGIALVLSLFLMLAMSVVGASMMFLSQTETYSSMNYRMMSQARYGAESGIQVAANYIFYTYAAPSTAGPDLLSLYNTNVSPVTLVANGQPVVLSYDTTKSNYGLAATETAYKNLFTTAMSLGATNTTKVNYLPTATLMSMELIPAGSVLGSANEKVLQTWQIVADGTITGGKRTATVEVSAVLDTQKFSTTSPAVNYAAFATAATCGALTYSGGASTASYNSAAAGFNPLGGLSLANGDLQTSCTDVGHDANCNKGAVGTNGNLTESGNSTVINGTLSTPRVGVGACSAGNIDAQTASGHASVTGGIVQLPAAVSLPAPVIAAPAGVPTTNVSISSGTTCATLPFALPAGATCGLSTVSGDTYLTITPNGSVMNLGNVQIGTHANLVIAGGTYNVNSIDLGSGASLTVSGQVKMTVIESVHLSSNSTLDLNSSASSLVMNIVNTGSVTTPLDFSGGEISNKTMDPSLIQIQYGGTGTIKLSGGTQQAAVIYAPNAAATFKGNASLYGEIVAATIDDSGGANMYYDRNLATKGLFTTTLYFAGNPMLSTFTWSKY
jgi:hypothetical protein